MGYSCSGMSEEISPTYKDELFEGFKLSVDAKSPASYEGIRMFSRQVKLRLEETGPG